MDNNIYEEGWDGVTDALHDAKGIAWDTCHKVYILLDDNQVELMHGYGYDPLITGQTPEQMLQTVLGWYRESCSLRFVDAVRTVDGDPNKGFQSIIPQGYGQED